MVGKVFADVSLKKKDTVRTLLNLRKGVVIEDKTIHINCGNLFNRLIVLTERQADTAQFFAYELTPVPTSLFKDDMMRKPDKAALSRLLTKDSTVSMTGTPPTQFVVDGGALLHRVRWINGATYMHVARQYVNFVARFYGNTATTVFDGYLSGPSTKDHEHQRRSTKMAAMVSINNDAIVHDNQQAFLANSYNKSCFIEFLMKEFKNSGFCVMQAPSDADTLIVRVALDIATSGQYVTVVADDTDVLVLLVHHWKPSMAEIYMKRVPRRPSACTTISIRLVQKSVGCSIVPCLLAIHALSGCDTTSAIYSHGKISAFKKFSLQGCLPLCDVIGSMNSTPADVGDAGCQLLVALYGGTMGIDTLNKLRYTTYMKLCSSSKSAIRPEQLPPTHIAAYYHCQRAHLQAMQWHALSTEHVDPCAWGWQLLHNKLVPITTDQPPAPDDLLKVIRCRCKTTSKNTCGTNLCSCRRNELPCVSACSNCHGSECNNCEMVYDVDDETSSENDNDKYFDDDDIIWENEEIAIEHNP